ncbi:transposase, partial [Oleidesulfovibrio alaskensis]
MIHKSHDFTFPPPQKGVQVNYCRTKGCSQFGLPVTAIETSKAEKVRKKATTGYSLHKPYKLMAIVKCRACAKDSYLMPARSNLAVVEEYERLAPKYALPSPVRSCINKECPNHHKEIGSGKGLYSSKGYTKDGIKRYQCLACKKTFTEESTGRRADRKPSGDQLIELLTSGASLQKISRELGIGLPSVYNQIGKLAEQQRALTAERITKLGSRYPEGIRLAVDEHTVYCRMDEFMDGRGVPFTIIGTICLNNGEILGLDINFDSSIDAGKVNDSIAPPYEYEGFSPHARVWTWLDYALYIDSNKSVREGIDPEFRD